MKELFSSEFFKKDNNEKIMEMFSIIKRLVDEKDQLRDKIRSLEMKADTIKESELKSYIKNQVITNLTEEESVEDIEAKAKAQAALNRELEKTKELTVDEAIGDLESDYEDAMKMKDDSVEQKAKKLRLIQREKERIEKEMRSVVRDYKKSKGAEKQGYLNTLKDLTKKRNSLESLISQLDV